jgi:hypothetical protein
MTSTEIQRKGSRRFTWPVFLPRPSNRLVTAMGEPSTLLKTVRPRDRSPSVSWASAFKQQVPVHFSWFIDVECGYPGSYVAADLLRPPDSTDGHRRFQRKPRDVPARPLSTPRAAEELGKARSAAGAPTPRPSVIPEAVQQKSHEPRWSPGDKRAAHFGSEEMREG